MGNVLVTLRCTVCGGQGAIFDYATGYNVSCEICGGAGVLPVYTPPPLPGPPVEVLGA